ncbi:patatin-like phospholipase family protein [Xanthobacter dioxanivorans]|uniref:Patatin-like phospholipase family protein n=1 Tax=Xanthobacter dioxanivorans TaxID=2528964 RepID=A0A974PNS6_9HYPH|nr:patatin-like phospholipase family protein [Xanthobacter dioxanivorans]QRG06589.1 patatin-like phospholipase family protein [Xanthobacter dioxanivorans]
MFQSLHWRSGPFAGPRPATIGPLATDGEPGTEPPDLGTPAHPATGGEDDGRPAIGLALGGGAARGFAHIGVLKVLEKNRIRPSVIAGTSIGAVVGGIWAAGKLDMLEAWALSLTKRNVLGLLDFALGGAGLIGGRRLVELMRREVGDLSIEDLPLVFAAIATELGTGHEIWLTRGDFVEAIRASYALPGIFTPVKVGGRWLMDGALVNPVPVSAARAMGARMVIAVNLNADVFGRGTVIQDHGGVVERVAEVALTDKKAGIAGMLSPDRLRRQFFAGGHVSDGPRGLSTVMIDAFNITQDRIARSRLAGDPPDLMLSPKLGRIGLFEFQRAKEAIAAGMEAAERALDDIQAGMVALG